jgi:hypothetical protein
MMRGYGGLRWWVMVGDEGRFNLKLDYDESCVFFFGLVWMRINNK